MIVIVAIACLVIPGVNAIVFHAALGALSGALMGGLFGGISSVLSGGSFWQGFEDGAFAGAISGGIDFRAAKIDSGGILVDGGSVTKGYSDFAD